VPDLDEHLAGVQARSVEPGEIQEIAGAGRRSPVVDPDGNVIWFVELVTGQ